MRIALLLPVLSLFAQDPTIRLDVRQVLVPVVVTDKKGHHVTGLRVSDFQILEDGVPQDIVSFSADATARVDDVASLSKSPAAAPASASGPRRTYVICVDTLHTSPAGAGRLKEALVSLFDKEKSTDAQYVLISIGSRLQVLQPATSNPQALLLKLRGPAFQSVSGGFDSSAFAAELQNLRSRMDEFCKRCACTRPAARTCESETATLKQNIDAEAARWLAPAAGLAEQFGNVVAELAKLPTARTLILVSDGFSIDPRRDFYQVVSTYLPNRTEFKKDEAQDTEPALRDALKIAADRNVVIYAIDSRGAATPSLASTGSMDAGSNGLTGGGGVRNRAAAPTSTGLQANPFTAHESATMDRLARSTGGVYFHDSADLLKDFRGALADGREYYLLAYTPKNTAQDGKFRTITVETRPKDVTIRAKAGYWASAQ
jgi:VWFA-related protein